MIGAIFHSGFYKNLRNILQPLYLVVEIEARNCNKHSLLSIEANAMIISQDSEIAVECQNSSHNNNHGDIE